MKKFTGLVIVLIIALVLGAYYGMGYLTEKKLKEHLVIVNQSNGLMAEIKDYKRGWFTSQVLVGWQLHVPEHVVNKPSGQSETVPAQDFHLNMPLTIYHGPIIFPGTIVPRFGLGYAHSELVLPPHLVEEFNASFAPQSVQPRLDLSLLVSYLTNTTIEASVPSFKLIAKQGSNQLDWFGFDSKTKVSSDMDKVKGSLSVDGLALTKEQVKTEISKVSSDYHLHKTAAGFYLGDANLAVSSLTIQNQGQPVFSLSQFDVQSDTDIKDGLFHSHFKSSIESVMANGKTYGPGNLEVTLRNLDAAVLARINEQFSHMQQGNEIEKQRALFAMLPELAQLFSKGAEFEISEMNFVMPQGKIEGNLLISLPKADINNPLELLQKTQGKGKLTVPVVVVRELLAESIRERLMTTAAHQPPQSIQQGIVQQMQQQADGANPQPTAPAPQSANPTAPNAVAPATQAAAPNPAEIAQQANALADKQLALMVESGALVQKDGQYVIEMNLEQGKLTINNKPYSSDMMKF